MKVALIHDHLAQDGGAEKVLKVFSDMFPEAPIYTLLYEKKNADKYFKNRSIMTSIIQRLPGGVRFYKWYLPYMALAVEFFDLSPYDLVISDTSSFAKGVITRDHTLHLCYCHTPTRYLWSDTHSYIQELNYNKYLKKIIALSLKKIRIWDRVAADRPDYFIANSNFIAKRITKYYRRTSQVIYPPVETEKFTVSDSVGDYFLAGGRLVPYKRFDLLVETFKANGRKLKIFGDGPDLSRLQKLTEGAGNIEFLGRVSEEDKRMLYAQALAFLNPQEEDFGITMVESLASGRPVIAFNSGGAKEIVADERVGLLFSEQTVASLEEALQKFGQAQFDAQAIKNYSEKFSVARFKEEISKLIEEKIKEFKK
jgi:glycosyltransferase involved in cell wall biosynthesis